MTEDEFPLMDDLISFMIGNCCQGTQCLPKTAALNKGCRSAPIED